MSNCGNCRKMSGEEKVITAIAVSIITLVMFIAFCITYYNINANEQVGQYMMAGYQQVQVPTSYHTVWQKNK